MKNDRALPVAATRRDLGTFVGGEPPPQEESPFEIINRLHRLLRGRYLITFSLAAIGAILGGAAGYLATTPVFMSEGAIRVAPVLPKKIYENEVNQMPPMFTSYVKTQANLLKEPRVIDRAIRSREWAGMGRTSEPASRDKFLESLNVITDREEPEWIRVQFVDTSAKAAQVAVEQIINSYTHIWGPTQGVFTPETVAELKGILFRLQGEIDAKRHDAAVIVGELRGADPLEMQSNYAKDLFEREREIDQLSLQIQQAELALSQTGHDQAAPADVELVNAEIGKVDADMRALLIQRLDAKTRLASMEARGIKPSHLSYKGVAGTIAGLEVQIADLREQWLSRGAAFGVDGGVLAPVSPQQLQVLKLRLDSLKNQLAMVQERASRVAMAKSQLDAIEAAIKQKREDLVRFQQRLNEIDVESRHSDAQGISGRIQVISKGEEPTSPYGDARLKLGAMGFLLGGALPVGLAMLIGLIDRRYRYSDDASAGHGQVTLLGILPYLPVNMADPEQAAVAAHCVHQIRTLLQIGGDRSRKVFTITSPTSGDGKTSLALSLGLSFAASGTRTLLIDFDMIGSGLTSAMQARSARGLFDAVEHGQLNGHVRATAFARLSIVPAGDDDASEVSRLSPALVRHFLDKAREEFDVIVIDTGPILGSLEASLVAAESDGVVLALGRGQQRSQVERAMNHLSSVGAKLIGVVFNRAQPGDFRRAVSSASVRSVPSGRNGTAAGVTPALGPMASTVASHIRPEGGSDDL